MPLSEHEQRLLEQIERALVAEDPKFASRYSQAGRRPRMRGSLVAAGLVFLAGLALLVVGVRTHILLGVLGFVFMLVGAGIAVPQLVGGGSRSEPASRQPPKPAPKRASVRDRMEERWRRRWEDRH